MNDYLSNVINQAKEQANTQLKQIPLKQKFIFNVPKDENDFNSDFEYTSRIKDKDTAIIGKLTINKNTTNTEIGNYIYYRLSAKMSKTNNIIDTNFDSFDDIKKYLRSEEFEILLSDNIETKETNNKKENEVNTENKVIKPDIKNIKRNNIYNDDYTDQINFTPKNSPKPIHKR